MSSLIPSRQFAFSPCLAATIGLEEAILLQSLSDESQSSQSDSPNKLDHLGISKSGYQWFELTQKLLLERLPFWTAQDIGRVAENLRQQGIILIASPPLPECGHIRFAFNEAVTQQDESQQAEQSSQQTSASHEVDEHAARTQTSGQAFARPISTTWAPDDTCLKLLAQQGVPANFARDCTAEFIQYWSERGEARHSWGNRFVTHVLHRWRDFENRQNQQQNQPHNQLGRQQAREQQNGQAEVPAWATSTAKAREAQAITRDWKPSTDALEILEIQAGIHRTFVEDAIPEFVLYWQEKGEYSNTWNARFINHVKRQWAMYQHTMENESEPRPIDPNWQPSPDVYDVLKMAPIDIEFAKARVPEFVIYWRDRNEARPSWNTVFINYVKSQWRRKDILENNTDNSNTRERSLVHDLSDRSWAN